jgi:hypothetical protein
MEREVQSRGKKETRRKRQTFPVCSHMKTNHMISLLAYSMELKVCSIRKYSFPSLELCYKRWEILQIRLMSEVEN